MRRNGTVILGTRYTNTSFFMLLLVFLMLGTLIAGVVVAMTTQSPRARFDLIQVPTDPLPTSTSPLSTSSATTLMTTTTTSTTSMLTTTPFVEPINISCPADVTVVLGAPFDPTNTGGFAVASGGCTVPVVQWTDSNVALIAKKDIKEHGPDAPRWFHEQTSEEMWGEVDDEDVVPVLLDTHADAWGRLDAQSTRAEEVNVRNGVGVRGHVAKPATLPHLIRSVRSATFNNSNLMITGTPFSVSNTGAIPPSSTASVSDDYVVMAVNAMPQGSLVVVTDKMTLMQSSFYMSSLSTGNCSVGARGDPQVLWDHEAKRWVLLELGAGTEVCVYVSNTSDPTSAYNAYVYDFAPYVPDFPKLGLWRQAYLLTVSKTPLFVGDVPKDMCVISRTLPVNGTAPDMLCAASFNGRLAGFEFQAWTPISADGGPMPPQLTESANSPGVGAVFFRHYDDELHDAATMTPTVDYIEVEHWSNINFTTNTFSAQRYRRTVADFDSSFDACVATDECVPTPTGQALDPVRQVIQQRAQYRYIPETGQESVVLTWTSHANGTATARVRWAEFRWLMPLVTQPRSWRLFQEGVVPFDDGVHRWMGAISMDANGTIALGYSESSASLYPSLAVRYRLGNDPLGMLRSPLTVASGAMGSVIPSKRWGDYASMSIDPTQSRVFYVTGQVSDDTHPWVAHLVRLRVQGEVVERLWRADDECGDFANCTQIITAI